MYTTTLQRYGSISAYDKTIQKIDYHINHDVTVQAEIKLRIK